MSDEKQNKIYLGSCCPFCGDQMETDGQSVTHIFEGVNGVSEAIERCPIGTDEHMLLEIWFTIEQWEKRYRSKS